MADIPHSDQALLLDMLKSAREALETVEAIDFSWEEFEASHMPRNAVIRCIEVIGEASKDVSPDTKKALPQIPWPKVYGMRNVLIHDYGEVELDEVWETVTEDIPALIDILEPLVSTTDAPD